MANENLAIELTLKAGSFVSGMAGVSKEFQEASKILEDYGKKIRGIGLAFTAFGTAAVGSLAVITKHTIDTADEIDKMSKRTGFSTTSLQELSYALKLSGSNLDNFNVVARTMQRNLSGLSEDSSTVKTALGTLGMTLDELKQLSPEQQFFKIATAISQIKDPTIKAGVALSLFGRSGTEILPLLSSGANGLEALRQQAHQLGVVLDDETIKSSVELKDNMERLKAAAGGLSNDLMTQLAPNVKELTDDLVAATKQMHEWAQTNPQLVKDITMLATALGSLAFVFGSVLTISGSIIALSPKITAAWTAMLGPIGLVTTAITALTAAVAAYSIHVQKMDPIKMNLDAAQLKLEQAQKLVDNIKAHPLEYQGDTNFVTKAYANLTTALSEYNDALKVYKANRSSASSPVSSVGMLDVVVPKKAKTTNLANKEYEADLSAAKNLSLQEQALYYQSEIKKTDIALQGANKQSAIYFTLVKRKEDLEQKLRNVTDKEDDLIYQNKLANISRFSKEEQRAFYVAEEQKTKQRMAQAVQGSDEYYSLLSRYGEQERALYALNAYTFVGGWKNALDEVTNAGLNWSQTFQNIFSSLQTAISDTFVAAINDMGKGWKNFAADIAKIGKTLEQSIIKAFTDMFAQYLVQRAATFAKDLVYAQNEIKTAAVVADAKATAASAWSLWGAFAIGAAIGAAVLALSKNLKFAAGGIVPGTSYSGDAITASVNSGEMVLNRAQQARLFAIANGQASNSNSANIIQNISIGGNANISEITNAIKRATVEGLELANAAYKAGSKQNGYAV